MPRILIIEDDAVNRTMLAALLTDAGYAVEEAEDGNQATRILTAGGIDAVITDILMPEKEGLEVITEQRKMNRDMPVIAMSGGGTIGSETYLNLARKLGAREVFEKPLDTKALLNCLNDFFQGQG